MRTLTFVILFTLQGTHCLAQDAFDELPVNTAGIIGQNVKLNCALSDGAFSLNWRNPDGYNVYEKGTGILQGFERQYVVEEYGNSYNLVVLNAEMDDAGRYVCYCATMSSSALAEIILLASDPGLLCTEWTRYSDDDDFGNLVEGEQITLTCQTTFYGLWGPTQDLTDSWRSIHVLPASDISAGNIIKYTHTVTVNAADNGLQWVVVSYFPPPPDGTIPDDVIMPPTEYYSRSAPTWNEVYESTTIVVYYPVTNMRLDNVKDEYTPGEVITCAAEGNPDPEIRWLGVNSIISNSAFLQIEPFMEGVQTYSCLATNIVHGIFKSCSETITFTVRTNDFDDSKNSDGTDDDSENSDETDAAIIGGFVGVIVFLLLVILFLLGVMWYLHKRIMIKEELSNAKAEITGHEYNYISEVPLQQSKPAGYVNTGTGLAETRPSVNQQYEAVGRNQREFRQMYSTPIQETNSEQIKKYENVPIPQEYEDLREVSRIKVKNEYDSLQLTLRGPTLHSYGNQPARMRLESHI